MIRFYLSRVDVNLDTEKGILEISRKETYTKPFMIEVDCAIPGLMGPTIQFNLSEWMNEEIKKQMKRAFGEQ